MIRAMQKKMAREQRGNIYIYIFTMEQQMKKKRKRDKQETDYNKILVGVRETRD